LPRGRVVALVALLCTACTSGATGHPIPLDGTPHPATDGGVMTSVDLHGFVLDGHRHYRVTRRLEAFLPETMQPTPLLGIAGRYVLIGATDSVADWVEPLSVVVSAGGQPTVYYFGTLKGTDGSGRAVFTDGTVLPVDPSAPLPATGGGPIAVRAEIDPVSRRIRRFGPA
jgi:hypothetical protein